MDSGDKATNKAMSIAFKYACFQLFCIPTEETHPDSDKESHEVKSEGKTDRKAEQRQMDERKIIKADIVAFGEALGMSSQEVAVRYRIGKNTGVEELKKVKAELINEMQEKGITV